MPQPRGQHLPNRRQRPRRRLRDLGAGRGRQPQRDREGDGLIVIEEQRRQVGTGVETLAGILGRYERVVAAETERIVAGVPGLSAAQPLPDAPWNEPARCSVRGVLLHLIAETAQHAGHADIIRESLDGQTSS